MTVNWDRFRELVGRGSRFVLTSHVRPDCDALGSELAMADVLTALGKDVRIVNGQPTPPNLAFLDPTHRIRTLGIDATAADFTDPDAILVLDTSAWAQLGPVADAVRASSAMKMVLDHHQSGDDLGAEVFKDVAAEATGRLVVEAADQLGVPLTERIAGPAFAALATDTGWFRFATTTGGTLRLAGRLVDAGAEPAALFAALYEQDSLARVKLRGRILARCETDLDGRLVLTAALAEDFAATGALSSDTEDVINEALRVAGAEAAVIFVELGPRRFKVSLRSRSQMDCSAVAGQFGGGGHKAAAGATLDGAYPSVRSAVLAAVRAAMS